MPAKAQQNGRAPSQTPDMSAMLAESKQKVKRARQEARHAQQLEEDVMEVDGAEENGLEDQEEEDDEVEDDQPQAVSPPNSLIVDC